MCWWSVECAEAAGGCGACLWESCGMGKGLHSQRGAVEDGQGRSLLFCRGATRVNSTRDSHWRAGNHPGLQGPRAWWHITDPVLLTHTALGGLGSGQCWAVPELLGLQSSARGAVGWENQVRGGEKAWGWGGGYSSLRGWGRRVTCDIFGDNLLKLFSWTEFRLISPPPHPISSVLCYTEELVSWKTSMMKFLIRAGRFRCEF